MFKTGTNRMMASMRMMSMCMMMHAFDCPPVS